MLRYPPIEDDDNDFDDDEELLHELELYDLWRDDGDPVG